MLCLSPTLVLTALLPLLSFASCIPSDPPQNYGFIVLPTWEPIDIAGPLDPLQILAHNHTLKLYLISHAVGPVTSEPQSAAMNPKSSSFWPVIQATHSFADVPDDLEVLVVPGGPSVRNPNTTPEAVDFIQRRFPKLRYLLTVCTGAGLAAKAGVLDGRRATTNKAAWELMNSWGPNVKWISPARWIVDGNVWTSSGGTSGIDLIYAFIAEMYSKEEAEHISLLTEHPIQEDNCIDPFGVQLNITTTEKCRV